MTPRPASVPAVLAEQEAVLEDGLIERSARLHEDLHLRTSKVSPTIVGRVGPATTHAETIAIKTVATLAPKQPLKFVLIAATKESRGQRPSTEYAR